MCNQQSTFEPVGYEWFKFLSVQKKGEEEEMALSFSTHLCPLGLGTETCAI